LGKISVKWYGVLAAFLLSAPLLSATAVGEGVGTQGSRPVGFVKPATVFYGVLQETLPPSPSAAAVTPAPAQTPVPTPVPPPPPTTPPPTPLPTATVPPPWTGDFCADAVSINVVDAELTGVVQAGIDAVSRYLGCQKFRIDGSGLPVTFHELTATFNGKLLAYAYSGPDGYQIWINPDCWGVVESWDGVVAHELGHYLGWQHGDDHPYMWLPPPPGSYARAGDSAIVCG
jgi:hypothetical protein